MTNVVISLFVQMQLKCLPIYKLFNIWNFVDLIMASSNCKQSLAAESHQMHNDLTAALLRQSHCNQTNNQNQDLDANKNNSGIYIIITRMFKGLLSLIKVLSR